jgi:pyruvate formate lyase activating enzyme
MDIAPDLEFARRLAALRKPVWVRFVLVPGLERRRRRRSSRGSPDFAAGLGNVERVDVLPFHQMGRFKWKELGPGVHAGGRGSRRPPRRASGPARYSGQGLKAY